MFLKRVAAATRLTGGSTSVSNVAVGESIHGAPTDGFQYRVGYIWLPQMSSRPFPSPFSSDLDDDLMEDYRRYLPRLHEAGFNYIAIAGLLGEDADCPLAYPVEGPPAGQLPADPERGFSPKRDRQIHEMIKVIHANSLRCLPSIGTYNWGYVNIILAHPTVAFHQYEFPDLTSYRRRNNSLLLDEYDRLEKGETREHADIMCASKQESWHWYERTISLLLDRYDLDGFHLETADRGRCWCQECRKIETVTYHARINERTTALVRQLAPGKVIGVNSGGLLLEGRRDLPAIKQMARGTDYFIDATEYALQGDVAMENQNVQDMWLIDRPAIAQAITPAAMGAMIHHGEMGEERSTWFTPAPQIAVRAIQRAYGDGCRALEYYACGVFSNPSRELNNYVIGHSLERPQQSAPALLETVVDQLYQPTSASVRAGLAELFMRAEMSCLANDILFNMHVKSEKEPVPYLGRSSVFKRLRYQRELECEFLPEARKLAPELRDRERANSLVRSIDVTSKALRAYIENQSVT